MMVEKNMNDAETEVREYLVPKAVVAPLQGSFNMVRNRLGEVFDVPQAQGNAAQAMQWWQKQSPEDQLTLRFILTGLASPALVNNIAILRGDTALIETTLVQQSLRPDDPCFLLGEDTGGNFKVRRLPSPETMAGTLLMYLDAGVEPGVADFKFEVNLNEFIVLLATIDLQRRSNTLSLLEHEEASPQLKLADVQKSIADGLQYPDPRWLIPFVLPILPAKPNLDWNAIWQAAYSLSTRGIVKISDDKTTVTLSEPGALLASEMERRMTMIRIASFGYDQQGKAGSTTTFLIRGESLVWYMDVGAASAVVAAIDLDKAGELLMELFKPSAAPPIAQAAPAAQVAAPKAAAPRAAPVAQQPARVCPDCGQPATWVEQYKRWYCYRCKKYLNP